MDSLYTLYPIIPTCTTLMVNIRDTGRVAMIITTEQMVSRIAQIPGPSSHAAIDTGRLFQSRRVLLVALC
jgi:hypothetical protein